MIKECSIKFKTNRPFSIKTMDDKDEDYKITGYASVFENVDCTGDIIKKGAFKKSIKAFKGQWPVLLNHKDAIGTNLVAKEDSHGLYVESSIYKDSDLPKGREAIALIKKSFKYKAKMGLSIGGLIKRIKFIYDPDADDGFKTKYEIYDFEMKEHSITPTPANDQALISQKAVWDFHKQTDCHTASEKILLDFVKKFSNMKVNIQS